jgi:hypothetical protein
MLVLRDQLGSKAHKVMLDHKVRLVLRDQLGSKAHKVMLVLLALEA